MRSEHNTYEITPQILRANTSGLITLRPRYDYGFFEENTPYSLRLIGLEGQEEQQAQVKPLANRLACEFHFGAEGEYKLLFQPLAEQGKRHPAEIRLYALEDDLWMLTPFKGDFHFHTTRSDGRESPAYVAAAGRGIGYDFLAITDHYLYEPSLEAIDAFRSLPVDLRLFPGEEIHPPENPLHIVNFGGNESINARFAQKARYYREVKQIEDEIDDLPEGMLRYQYASAVWCYRRIRAAGGLGIFVHPYWFTEERYNVPEALIEKHFREQPFDAFELIGGYPVHEAECNALQVSRYHHERSQGRQVPIVGATDCHGVHRGDYFGWYTTIVFAPTAELPDVIAAVKGLRSVAVEALPGQAVHIHGPFRLVKYAHFLTREIFPLHDALCAQEGALMKAYLTGDPAAREGLARCQGQVRGLWRRLWGQA